jgi:hypothetical protein
MMIPLCFVIVECMHDATLRLHSTYNNGIVPVISQRDANYIHKDNMRGLISVEGNWYLGQTFCLLKHKH